MASVKKLLHSFARGEVTPQLFGRVDLDQFQTGLALCRNWITRPHGVVDNRPGTTFVSLTKNGGVISRLVNFSFNNQQTFAIELGVGYFRFYTAGARLLYGAPAAYNGGTAYVPGNLVASGGSVYYCIANTTGNAPPNATYWYLQPVSGQLEVPNPYTSADLFDVHYVQSNDTMTFTHPNYAPSELKRLSAVNWSFLPISFGDTIVAPTGVGSSNNGAATTPTSYSYVVTTRNTGDLQESLASSVTTVSNDLTVAGRTNTISWSAVTGAIQYNVYKLANGLYGFIGTAGGLNFIDNNITPNISQTPPYVDTPFVDNTTYPSTVSYFQSRRYFAASNTEPQNFWATRSNTESNLTYSIPSKDDDRLSFRIAARDANAIKHLIPLSDLLMLTAAGEWRITSNSGVVKPSDIIVTQQAGIGASNVTPCIVNKGVVYGAARGGRIREMIYNWQVAGYITNDVSKLAPHLFDYYTIVDMAYARAPYPIIWCVSSNGSLLGMTYQPEDQIAGWHHHDTMNGTFESICVVSENNEDILYAIVNRTLNGVQNRYVERLSTRNFSGVLANAYFVDCGGQYNGAPATVISGLTWLIGSTVSILADGAVSPQQVVDGTGAITLPVAASVVQVGLPITADIQTLPFTMDSVQANSRGEVKNVNKVWIRVDQTSGLNIGPSFSKLKPIKLRTTETYGTPPRLQSGEIEGQVMEPLWAADGTVCIRQSDPLPATIVTMTYEVALGN